MRPSQYTLSVKNPQATAIAKILKLSDREDYLKMNVFLQVRWVGNKLFITFEEEA